MLRSLLGRKLGMTQIYDEQGNVLPVTALEAGPCSILQVRTPERDGYSAIQLGFLQKKRSRASKPEAGHARRANCEPHCFVREVPLPEGDVQPGQRITVEVFSGVSAVDVTGISKGHGFQGVVKRHGMRGGPASHGSTRHRRVGSVGQSAFPSRVLKGKRLPGHMGCNRVTVRRLKVVRVDTEKNLLLVRGAVPGPRGGYLIITEAKGKTSK